MRAWPRQAGPSLVLGALVAVIAQVVLPAGVPLYDGVPVIAPYRYLAPGDGQAGDPTSDAMDLPASDGTSPEITAATQESPPQAQLIALSGIFALPSGTTTVHVAIDAVEVAAAPTQGTISGNVYRIAVTTPGGSPLALAGAERPTVVLRSAQPLADAAILRLDGGTWKRLDTVVNASLQILTAQPDGLGDFAVVDLAGGGMSATTLVVGATVGVVVAAIVIWAIRSWLRARAPASQRTAGPRGSRPSDRPPGVDRTRPGGGPRPGRRR